MRIMYGICGEGMGHAVRAQPIITWLRRTHEVVVVAGDRAYDYLRSRFPQVHKTTSLRIIYRNNRVANFLTTTYNITRTPLHFLSFFRIFGLMIRHRPELLICDFDHLTNWAANLLGIPIISFDNEMIIPRTTYETPPKTGLSRLKTLLVACFINPHSTHYLITTFFLPSRIKPRTTLCAPVLRPHIERAKPKKGNHLLVYQTSESNHRLLSTLHTLPHKFIVYGFNKNTTEGNCTFKTFSEIQLVKDLATCRGVITNGGFTLITEALHLGKPVLSIPVQGQYEQELNAFYVENTGQGISARVLTPQVMQAFAHQASVFQKTARKLRKNSTLPHWQHALQQLLSKYERKKGD